ncbi:hypothetical protein FIU86_06780 [Roseovarius sp. THAF9]|uniref:hypothetical protein n=1 Tax=Roseovarius sp. THAF9 TaxID=2587847 RepID=UPI001267C778|nr:hypothetical protein [Roseovarius sp. THAF9]QFT92539.1 hypothetical protein FIU86_06780 [Roseovarius sp. THAF9]
MRQLRAALAKCLMVVLMAMFVMGSFGMGAAGAAAATAEPAHMMDHAGPSARDCPTMDETDAPMQKGHAACTMTVCCFSEGPDFRAIRPEAQILPASYLLSIEDRLTQAEPERAKKPPKHA